MGTRRSWPRVWDVAPQWWRAPLPVLLEAWEFHVSRQRDWFGGSAIAPTEWRDLAEALDQVTYVPGTSLLVATGTEWTAVYDSAPTERAFPGNLAAYIPCDTAVFHLSADPDGGEGASDRGLRFMRAPGTRDEIVHAPQHGQRLVRTYVDGKRWVWEQYGSPLPFEQVERYTRSRRSERLTVDMVFQYAAELGVPLGRPDAFAGKAVLVYAPVFERPPRLFPSKREWDDFVEICLQRLSSRGH